MTRPPVISDTKTHLLFHSRQSASDAQLVLRVGRRIWQWFTAPLRWCVILPSVMLIALVTVSACMAVTHASAPAHEFKARLIVTFFFRRAYHNGRDDPSRHCHTRQDQADSTSRLLPMHAVWV